MAKIRAMWLPRIAKAIGWTPDRLRKWLNQRGISYPYLSESKVLQALVNAGISIKRYTPTQDAVSVSFVRQKGADGSPAAQRALNEAEAKTTPEDDKKKHGRWTDRLLITRLSRLLPEGPTKKGKQRVAYILKKAGHKKIKNLEETIALEVFEKAGYSIEGFEYEKKLGEPGGPLVAAPASEYEGLLAQYYEMGDRLRGIMREGVEKDRRNTETDALLQRVRHGLLNYEKMVLPIAVPKFGGLQPPLDGPITVLGWIREFYATKARGNSDGQTSS